jgi:hypothetical protein
MEDPVNDGCGHTFERKAILDWVKTCGNGCCPISRKPMIMMTSRIDNNVDDDDEDDDDNDIIISSCNDNIKNTTTPMLYSDGHLKARIQEWKMNHPLYQGIDINYAKHQKDDMLNSNYYKNNNNKNDYDDGNNNDTISQNSNSIHSSSGTGIHIHNNTRSRFELMLLPQERNVLNIVKIRARIQKERRDRTRCWYTIICFLVLFIIIILIIIFVVGIKQIRNLLGI